jgi:hypothetical protein
VPVPPFERTLSLGEGPESVMDYFVVQVLGFWAVRRGLGGPLSFASDRTAALASARHLAKAYPDPSARALVPGFGGEWVCVWPEDARDASLHSARHVDSPAPSGMKHTAVGPGLPGAQPGPKEDVSNG